MEGLAGEFARFADFFPEALLLVTGDGRIQAANRAAHDQLLAGTPPDVERTLQDLVADSPEKALEYLRLCARSRERLPGTLTFRPGEHAETYHCLGARFTSDAPQQRLVMLRLVPRQESISRFVALKQHIDDLEREIARRLEAETTAEEQRELLHVTLASIGDAVMTTDTRGSIMFMNGVAEKLSGWREQEAIGKPLENVFVIRNEYSGAGVESPVGKVLREGLVVGLANHTVLIRKDGTQLPIDDSGAPIRDRHGHLLGVVLVFHEVSERRRMERELKTQAEALSEADRRKDEFLAMLAHELRNPLAPLHNGVQILRLQGQEANIERLADMMERQTTQLTRLVDDLLDVARITRGSVRLERAPISLATVIEHALETARPLIDERDHGLSVRLPQETLTVDADLTRLSQVFSNLLNNAAKFMEPGGEITLEVFTEGDCAVVSIRDEGYGMEPELLARIFDLFAQADRSLDRKDGGLGIGLTLVKTLVQMHDGEVSAFSEGRGMGSKFVVSLPLAERAQAGLQGREQAQSAELRTRVLIVEDNADAAESLAILFRSWSCETLTASDGEAALAVAQSSRPEVVLLDIGLPGMDGFEVARRMRQLPGMPEARIVALTGYGHRFNAHGTAGSAFDDYLTKPVDLDRLKGLLAFDAASRAPR